MSKQEDHENLTHRLTIRVSHSELKRLKDEQYKGQSTMSDMIRKMIHQSSDNTNRSNTSEYTTHLQPQEEG